MSQKLLSIISLLLFASTLMLSVSCSPEADTEGAAAPSTDPEEVACLESGDILVANSGTDAITVFNSQGEFKRVAFNVSSATENLYGIWWSEHSDEVMVAIDGVDRVVAISPEDCSTRDVIVDINLTGTIRGLTQLVTSNDILVVETNNIERFGANGNRVVSGWPLIAQTGGTGVGALASGGFVHCSSTADVVRTYSAAGAQTFTRASGIAATTDAMDCKELANGNIAVAWSGTSDTLAVYNPTLATVVSTYSNTANLAAPGGLIQRDNGNILVVDRVYNYVVEISEAGAYVNTFGSGYLSTPEFITVVP